MIGQIGLIGASLFALAGQIGDAYTTEVGIRLGASEESFALQTTVHHPARLYALKAGIALFVPLVVLVEYLVWGPTAGLTLIEQVYLYPIAIGMELLAGTFGIIALRANLKANVVQAGYAAEKK